MVSPSGRGRRSATHALWRTGTRFALAKDFPPFSAYTAGVEVSYDLDVFGATRSRVEEAAAAAQYQSTQLAAVALMVSGNVAIEALQIATVRAQIRVADQIVSDDEHMLSLIRAAASWAQYRRWTCSAHKASSTTIARSCRLCANS
jgi:outer membrane protein TolC